ncbi:MAG: hypothetical protein WEA04_04840 [Candidatus Andersenbacteria bacterium]
MKEEINLLPPAFQKLRRRRIYLVRIGELMRRIDFVIILIGIVFVALYGALFSLQANLERKLAAAGTTEQSTEERVRSVNELLTAVHSRTVPVLPWMPGVGQIIQLLPPSIVLTELRLDEVKNVLTIQGIFSDRQAIVKFEQEVAALPWVEKVEAPLRNFATGEKTEFTFTVTRKIKKP